MNTPDNRRATALAGIVLGIGMGGFSDGILFHQILQIHNMLSALRPRTTLLNAEVNMFWDGLFHAFTWITTAVGIGMLVRVARVGRLTLPVKSWLGTLLIGWGLFNLVEGMVNHVMLGLHHVVERLGLSVWDAGLLVASAAAVAVGVRLARAGLGKAAVVAATAH